MSGRLVILPHKSWNVWNQDNREKVARDERLHREAEEAKAAKDKQLLQEQNLELLRDGELAIKLEHDSISSSGQVEPFRLFEDLEKQHYARLGNEDYLKEKAQKELLQKKRDGIADWALGEGSVENSKVRPWYETLGMGESVSSSATATGPRLGRETNRKEHADPMGRILKPNSHEYVPRLQSEQSESGGLSDLRFLESAGAKLDSIESKENDSSDSEHSRRKEKKKRHKEDRKSKKHSKRKHSDSSDDERSRKKDKKSKHHPPEVKIKTEGRKPADDPWAELRTKRLEREAIERKRAAVLLATVDVYGPGGSGSSSRAAQGYGQQYHPHLARHKR